MTNRRDKLLTGLAMTGVVSLVATIVLSAPAAERAAGALGATTPVRVHEHGTPPVAGLGRMTVHVWRRGTEVQVVALDERGAVVVLRAGTMLDGTSSVTAPTQGLLSARIRTIDANGSVAIEECAKESCAKSVAGRAIAVAGRATFIPRLGGRNQSLAVRMCPTEGGDTATRTSIPHWMRSGANAPCKWQIVPAATLAAWPVTGRSNRVWVGDTVFRIHRAALRLMHAI